MKKSQPVVSIITPCFNGEKVVHRMIESVLAQTYDNIEYILVNDGSTDRSEEVVLSYQEQFQKRGYEFHYIKQENKGLGGAINAGLKVFSGDYLCWADADDFFAPSSVEKRVLWMETHPDYGVITSDAYIVKETDLLNPCRKISQGITDNENENQFWNLLEANSIFCCACHMIRSAYFLKINPNREIYPARRGQNWQMLLPMYYHYKRHFLDEPLFYCVESDNSMSYDDTPKKQLLRCDEHEEILEHVIQGLEMNAEDGEKAKSLIKVNYIRKRLYIAFNAGLADVANEQFKKLKAEGKATFRDRMYRFCANNQWVKRVLKQR